MADSKIKTKKVTKTKAPSPEIIASPKTVDMKLVNPMGRPSIYSDELCAAMCSQLAMGYSLRTVCGQEGMPTIQTVFNWLHSNKNFLEQYTRAKAEAADAMADEILDISDDGTNDWMKVRFGNEERWITNGEALQRSRLRVETRKWLMAKMQPRKYGDKLDVTSDGKALPAPMLGGVSIKKDEPEQG